MVLKGALLALGMYGKYLMVVPELNLVMAVMGNNQANFMCSGQEPGVPSTNASQRFEAQWATAEGLILTQLWSKLQPALTPTNSNLSSHAVQQQQDEQQQQQQQQQGREGLGRQDALDEDEDEIGRGLQTGSRRAHRQLDAQGHEANARIGARVEIDADADAGARAGACAKYLHTSTNDQFM
jgi:hypothetical protein